MRFISLKASHFPQSSLDSARKLWLHFITKSELTGANKDNSPSADEIKYHSHKTLFMCIFHRVSRAGMRIYRPQVVVKNESATAAARWIGQVLAFIYRPRHLCCGREPTRERRLFARATRREKCQASRSRSGAAPRKNPFCLKMRAEFMNPRLITVCHAEHTTLMRERTNGNRSNAHSSHTTLNVKITFEDEIQSFIEYTQAPATL